MYSKNYEIGLKIRQMRLAKGWTQEQLAEMLGIDNKHLSRIEMGYHMPNYQLTKKLVRVFDFDLRTFDDSPIENSLIPDTTIQKSMRILNTAKNEEEKKYYLDVLRLAQKGLKLSAKKN